MFGLVLLLILGLGLILWLTVVMFAVRLGRKLAQKYFKHPNAGKYGAWAGFMLTMGGFIIYWILEYIYTQIYVSHLCENAGVTVYVTPQQFRKQIGEWRWYALKNDDYEESDFNKNITYKFEGEEYYQWFKINKEITSYITSDHIYGVHGSRESSIYIGNLKRNVLMKQVTYGVGVGNSFMDSDAGWKFWLNNIDDCGAKDNQKLFKLQYGYSNKLNENGEIQ